MFFANKVNGYEMRRSGFGVWKQDKLIKTGLV